MRMMFARSMAMLYILGLYALLPLMPLLATLVFFNWKYVAGYGQTLKKMQRHIAALRQGPALHYFHDVLGRVSQVPETIQGECVQCGNCCMNRQCMFLEPMAGDKYQCGIYHSPFRRFSNCGSFPLNGHDIERYACPSYSVASVVGSPAVTVFSPRAVPVQWSTNPGISAAHPDLHCQPQLQPRGLGSAAGGLVQSLRQD
jgi:hypothetical protein